MPVSQAPVAMAARQRLDDRRGRYGIPADGDVYRPLAASPEDAVIGCVCLQPGQCTGSGAGVSSPLCLHTCAL